MDATITDRHTQVLVRLLAMANRPVAIESVDPETTFAELGITSLQAIELVLDWQEEFGIEISDEEIGSIETVGDVMRLIESKTRPAGA